MSKKSFHFATIISQQATIAIEHLRIINLIGWVNKVGWLRYQESSNKKGILSIKSEYQA